MAVRKKVTAGQRRQLDLLRRKGLKTAGAYEDRLVTLRRKEVRRVLSLCDEAGSTEEVVSIIQGNLSEEYLQKWFEGLYVDCGVPKARATVAALAKGKAATALTPVFTALEVLMDGGAERLCPDTGGPERPGRLRHPQDVARPAGARHHGG